MVNTSLSLLPAHLRDLVTALPAADLALLQKHFASQPRTAVPTEFARVVPQRQLDTAQMTKLEAVLEERIRLARNGREGIARLRLWLIFMLLRYAALRLAEVLAIDDVQDIVLEKQHLLVRGAHARTLSLPPNLCTSLQKKLQEPCLLALRGTLCRVDAGFLRRSLYACADAAGIARELVSARVLRNSRAVELCRQGLPLPVVHNFLGLSDAEKTAFLQYSPEDTLRITHAHLQRSLAMKTSARNVFAGRITRLEQHGFMVAVHLATASNLTICALITDESAKRLELQTGKIALATIKAPMVLVEKSSAQGVLAGNQYAGVVKRVRRTDFIQEITVALPSGEELCALLHGEEELFTEGEQAVVSFKAFAVVIGLA